MMAPREKWTPQTPTTRSHSEAELSQIHAVRLAVPAGPHSADEHRQNRPQGQRGGHGACGHKSLMAWSLTICKSCFKNHNGFAGATMPSFL